MAAVRISTPVTKNAVSKSPAATTAAKATALARELNQASDPGHISNAVTAAVKFLTSPASKSLSVTQASKLHVALGKALAELSSSVGWAPKATNKEVKSLISQLSSEHPGEMSNGIKATMAYLHTAAGAKVSETDRNSLLIALGQAQADLANVR